jgi:hypothetical protein
MNVSFRWVGAWLALNLVPPLVASLAGNWSFAAGYLGGFLGFALILSLLKKNIFPMQTEERVVIRGAPQATGPNSRIPVRENVVAILNKEKKDAHSFR